MLQWTLDNCAGLNDDAGTLTLGDAIEEMCSQGDEAEDGEGSWTIEDLDEARVDVQNLMLHFGDCTIVEFGLKKTEHKYKPKVCNQKIMRLIKRVRSDKSTELEVPVFKAAMKAFKTWAATYSIKMDDDEAITAFGLLFDFDITKVHTGDKDPIVLDAKGWKEHLKG